MELENIEQIMLTGLVTDKEYIRKCIPHIKEEYFEDRINKKLYGIINEYVNTYNKRPSKAAIRVELENKENISEDDYKELGERVNGIFSDMAKSEIEELSGEWLVEQTEKYCQERAVFNAISDSISIIEGDDKTHSKEAIPGILQDALSVGFNSSLGHDYLADFAARFDYYQKTESKIATPLAMLDHVTNGGVPPKTLNVYVGPTGTGKTIFLSNHAAFSLMKGMNCLYVTLEMSDMRISQRADAKLLDVDINSIERMQRNIFLSKLQALKEKTQGRLIVEEYPPGFATTSTIRGFLEELKIKRNFIPDIIFIDYLGIMASSRFKSADNSYQYFKSVAEEMRGLGVEYNVPVWTAAQSNRDGQNSSDFDLNEMAESHGISQTADFIIGGISTPDMNQMNQIRIKQLKNRYGDVDGPRSFIAGMNKSKMTLYDIDNPNENSADSSGVNNSDRKEKKNLNSLKV